MKLGRIGVMVASGALIYGADAMAQQRVATRETTSAEVRAAQAILMRPVTVSLDKVSLRTALDVIARKGSIHLQYQSALVDEVTRPVSAVMHDRPLKEVLDGVLAGTGLRIAPVEGALFTVLRASQETPVIAASGVITGRVIHATTKQPVVGAIVQVRDQQVVTGEDGSFRIPAPSGDVVVQVRAVGLVRLSQTVQVPDDGRTVSVLLTMERSASVLDQVIVTGTVVATERKAIPNPITVITAEEIERRGITRIEEFLRGEVPGVIALDPGIDRYDGGTPGRPGILGGMVTTKVYARGASGMASSPSGSGQATPLKVYVDGVELMDPSYLGTIEPNTIDRIEIITGPQAATIYGSGAMGGVMQIFTKQGSSKRGADVSIALRYGILQNDFSNGLTPEHHHTFGISGGRGAEFTYTGTLAYRYTGQWQPGGFNRSYGGSVGAAYSTGSITTRGSLSLMSGRNGTSMSGNGSPLYTALANSGVFRPNSEFPPGAATHRVSTSSGYVSSLDMDYRLMQFWQHHASLGKSITKFALMPSAPWLRSPADTLFSVAQSNGERTTLSYNGTLILRPNRILSSVLTAGVNGSRGDEIRSDGCTLARTRTDYKNCTYNNFVEAVRVYKPINDESWGGFGTLRLGILDRIYMTMGIRGEKNAAYGTDHKIDWTPNYGITYSWEYENLTVKFLGSYGRATRAPVPSMRDEIISIVPDYEPSRFVSQFANPELTPEYSRGPQGGIEIYYGNRMSFTVNHYRQTVSDLIQLVAGVDSIWVDVAVFGIGWYQPISQYQNVAKIRQTGWESTGAYRIGPFNLKGTYSWNDSRVLKLNQRTLGYTPFTPGQSFTSLPTHTGHFAVEFAQGKSSATFTLNYLGQSMHSLANHPIIQRTQWSRLQEYLENRTFSSSLGAMRIWPGYTRSDLVVSHRVTANLSAVLNIANLGNSTRSDVSIFSGPTLGRRTSVGVTLRMP